MREKIFGIVYILSFALFPWLVLSPLVNLPSSLIFRFLVFGLIAIFGAFIFRQAWHGQGWANALLVTVLGYGTAYKLASFIPDISSYPFSLGWSEASRYYYASLWLSKSFYGTFVAPSVLHPSRYLLQALPLLIPNASLWINRLWQVVLCTHPYKSLLGPSRLPTKIVCRCHIRGKYCPIGYSSSNIHVNADIPSAG